SLDQVQHRPFESVHVLEDEQYRLLPGQAVDEGDETALNVVDEGRLLGTLGQPEHEAQALHDPSNLVRTADEVGQLAKPAADLGRRLTVLDPRQVADDRGHDGKGRRVGVGAAAPAKDVDRRADTGRHLVGQARLADPRLTDDGDQDGATGG